MHTSYTYAPCIFSLQHSLNFYTIQFHLQEQHLHLAKYFHVYLHVSQTLIYLFLLYLSSRNIHQLIADIPASEKNQLIQYRKKLLQIPIKKSNSSLRYFIFLILGIQKLPIFEKHLHQCRFPISIVPKWSKDLLFNLFR